MIPKMFIRDEASFRELGTIDCLNHSYYQIVAEALDFIRDNYSHCDDAVQYAATTLGGMIDATDATDSRIDLAELLNEVKVRLQPGTIIPAEDVIQFYLDRAKIVESFAHHVDTEIFGSITVEGDELIATLKDTSYDMAFHATPSYGYGDSRDAKMIHNFQLKAM